MWARRLIAGSGFAIASVLLVPHAAGAAACGSAGSMTQPGCVMTPTIHSSRYDATRTATRASYDGSTSSSLPFTGADIGELAVIGGGAVALGMVLTRRRRETLA